MNTVLSKMAGAIGHHVRKTNPYKALDAYIAEISENLSCLPRAEVNRVCRQQREHLILRINARDGVSIEEKIRVEMQECVEPKKAAENTIQFYYEHGWPWPQPKYWKTILQAWIVLGLAFVIAGLTLALCFEFRLPLNKELLPLGELLPYLLVFIWIGMGFYIVLRSAQMKKLPYTAQKHGERTATCIALCMLSLMPLMEFPFYITASSILTITGGPSDFTRYATLIPGSIIIVAGIFSVMLSQTTVRTYAPANIPDIPENLLYCGKVYRYGDEKIVNAPPNPHMKKVVETIYDSGYPVTKKTSYSVQFYPSKQQYWANLYSNYSWRKKPLPEKERAYCLDTDKLQILLLAFYNNLENGHSNREGLCKGDDKDDQKHRELKIDWLCENGYLDEDSQNILVTKKGERELRCEIGSCNLVLLRNVVADGWNVENFLNEDNEDYLFLLKSPKNNKHPATRDIGVLLIPRYDDVSPKTLKYAAERGMKVAYVTSEETFAKDMYGEICQAWTGINKHSMDDPAAPIVLVVSDGNVKVFDGAFSVIFSRTIYKSTKEAVDTFLEDIGFVTLTFSEIRPLVSLDVSDDQVRADLANLAENVWYNKGEKSYYMRKSEAISGLIETGRSNLQKKRYLNGIMGLMGAGGSRGDVEHADILYTLTEHFTRKGFDCGFVPQGGNSKLPDAIITGTGDSFKSFSKGHSHVHLEAECKTHTKPARILRNHAKAINDNALPVFGTRTVDEAEYVHSLLKNIFGAKTTYNMDTDTPFVPEKEYLREPKPYEYRIYYIDRDGVVEFLPKGGDMVCEAVCQDAMQEQIREREMKKNKVGGEKLVPDIDLCIRRGADKVMSESGKLTTENIIKAILPEHVDYHKIDCYTIRDYAKRNGWNSKRSSGGIVVYSIGDVSEVVANDANTYESEESKTGG